MKNILFSFAFLLLAQLGFSQLSAAKIFSDNMVLQRDVKIPVWGWAKEGEHIKMIFDGQTYHTTAAHGKWEFTLPPHPAGKRYGILIQGVSEKIALRNITFGDVWLCGGQSNMEWFLEAAKNGEEEVQKANYPDIRLFEVPHKIAPKPVKDLIEGSWQACTPETAKQFSAVGYFFGRKLHQELKIPIGLINDNYGGTVIETWMSPDAFTGMPNYEKQIAQLTTKDLEKKKAQTKTKFDAWISKFSSEDLGKKRNTFIWKNNDFAQAPTMQLPTQWESAGIKELENLNGVVWLEKDFYLTKQQAESLAELSLGPIDDSDITWINGHKIGETANRWNKNRNYTIPENILKPGENKLVVRIEDYLGGGGIYGKENQLFIQFKGQEKKISLAGKWHYKVGYTATEPMPMSADFGPNSAPTLLYNGMIYPIKKFPVKGVIWYQGETNTYRAVEYKTLKPKWIRNWRKLWNNPTMPIIWVQLANYQTPQIQPHESAWAELREAQQEALAEPNTAMITAIDIGEAKTIHPLNKQEVGRRLALAALAEVYQKSVKYKSPRFLSIKKKRKYFDISFTDVYDGLQLADTPKDKDCLTHQALKKYKFITGFTIAGKDQIFHWAKAQLLAPNKIRVFIPKRLHAVAVRYAWANNPDPANIINSEGFPLLPFRTDHWKLSTDGITR